MLQSHQMDLVYHERGEFLLWDGPSTYIHYIWFSWASEVLVTNSIP